MKRDDHPPHVKLDQMVALLTEGWPRLIQQVHEPVLQRVRLPEMFRAKGDERIKEGS